jgi:hypothetical protein
MLEGALANKSSPEELNAALNHARKIARGTPSLDPIHKSCIFVHTS